MYCNVFVSCNKSKCINFYNVIIGNILNIISQKATKCLVTENNSVHFSNNNSLIHVTL